MSVSVVIKNAAKTVGEGPVWLAGRKALLYVDIITGEIHLWDSNTDTDSTIYQSDDQCGFAIPRQSGGYIIGCGRKLCLIDETCATSTVLTEVEESTHNRFNDAKCDTSGRLWAGTMYMKRNSNGTVETGPHANFYSLEKDHSLKHHFSEVWISNGMAWTKDNKTMFWIDSTPRKIYAFDFDAEKGCLSNRRVVIDTSSYKGAPDGCCIDNEDKLWVAFFGGSCIKRFDPQTGDVLQTINFPCTNITSCCFGGDNYDVLYVTSSRYDLSEEQPLAGSVFKVTGLGVTGTPFNAYQG